MVRRQFDESSTKKILTGENSSPPHVTLPWRRLMGRTLPHREEIEKDVGNTTLSATPPREKMTLKLADIPQISDTDSMRNESYVDRKIQRKGKGNRQIQNNKHKCRDSRVPVEKTGSPHTSTGKSTSCNGGCSDEEHLKSALPMAASSPLQSVNHDNRENYHHNISTCSFSSGFCINSKVHHSGVITDIIPRKSNTECVMFEKNVSGYNEDGVSCKETTAVPIDLVNRVKSEDRKQHSSTLTHTDCDLVYVSDYEYEWNFDMNRKDEYSVADVKDPSTTTLDGNTLDEGGIKPQSSLRCQLDKDKSICSEPQCLSGLERHVSAPEAKSNYEYPEVVQKCGDMDLCSGHRSMFEKSHFKCGTFKVGYKRKKLGKLRRLWISELNLKGLLAGVYSVHIKVTKDNKTKQPYVPKSSRQSSFTNENDCNETKPCQNSGPNDGFCHHESITSQRERNSALMPLCEAGCEKPDISFGDLNFHDGEL